MPRILYLPCDSSNLPLKAITQSLRGVAIFAFERVDDNKIYEEVKKRNLAELFVVVSLTIEYRPCRLSVRHQVHFLAFLDFVKHCATLVRE